jgi:hypothetical protein
MGPGGIADDKPVLAFGDCTCQMAILLSLSVVMGLRHSEDSAKLVLEFVDSLWVITLLRHVSLSQRLMSMLYDWFDAEEDIVEVD